MVLPLLLLRLAEKEGKESVTLLLLSTSSHGENRKSPAACVWTAAKCTTGDCVYGCLC